jgi:hypothetical protein
VILWKLHIIHHILLEAFKRINCALLYPYYQVPEQDHTVSDDLSNASFNFSITYFCFFFGTVLSTCLIRWRNISESLIQERFSYFFMYHFKPIRNY